MHRPFGFVLDSIDSILVFWLDLTPLAYADTFKTKAYAGTPRRGWTQILTEKVSQAAEAS
jgi:hypothetical protein